MSQLTYGLSDNPSDSESIVYRPYNTLMLNSEGSNIHIRFRSIMPESNLVAYAMMLSQVIAKLV